MPATNEDLSKWLAGESAQPRRALDIGSPARPAQMDDAETRKQLSQQDADNRKRKQRAAEEAFISGNAEPGVPLDTQSGAPSGTRAKLSFERNVDKQAEYLAKQPGVLGVRKTDDGSGLIMRVKDDAGGERDVLVDERKTTLKDIADLAGDAPSVAASMVAAFFTGGMSLAPQALTVAGAGAAAGATSDVITRASRDQDIEPGEIAANRLTGAAIDTAIPLVPGGAKRVAQRLIAPFAASAGPLEREAAQSAARLGIPLSAAQRTGNSMLARAETFSSRLPGGGALLEQRQAQDTAVREAQEFILGGKPAGVPSEQAIADKVAPIVSGEREAARGALASERTAIAEKAQQDIISKIDAGITPASLPTSEVGGLVRKRVVGLRDGFRKQAAALYNEVYEKAGGDFVNVPLAPVKGLVDEIRANTSDAAIKAAPGVKRALSLGESLPSGGTKIVESPILDHLGNVIMQAEKLPDGLPLNQVIELRALINDQIGRGDAIGSIPDRYLKRLAGSLTESIEQAVDKVENAEVKAALSKANAFYRTERPKFDQRGVSELFTEATQTGFVDDSRVVQRVFDGKGDLDLLNRYEGLLGAGSAEYKALVRSGVNRIINESTPLGERFVDAGSFLQKLGALDPEVRAKVLPGNLAKDLVGGARLMEVARGKKVAADELADILNQAPPDASKKLTALIAKEEAFDRAYNTRLMRQLTDGTFDGASLNADEFVSRFVENGSAREIRHVMTMIRAKSPEAAEDIRRRAVLNVLNRAGGRTAPEDAVGESLGNIAYDKLSDALGANAEKLQVVIGKNAVESLTDLAKVEAVRAKAATQGGAAGQLVYSNILAALMDFKMSEVPRIFRNRIVAAALTWPGMKTWLSQTTLIPATPRARAMVFASAPVLTAVANEFKNEPDLLGQVLDAAAFGPDASDAKEVSAQDEKLLEFLRGAPTGR